MTFRRIMAEIAARCHILAMTAGDPGKIIVRGELGEATLSALAVNERMYHPFQIICAENGFWTMDERNIGSAC